MKYTSILSLLILCCLLSGCKFTPDERLLTTPKPAQEEIITIIAAKPTPSKQIPTILPRPSMTAEPEAMEICSPIEGYTYPDLVTAIVNPYLPPPPGIDRPHQGVDLAVLDVASGLASSGESVHAILSGEVRMVITDRFPYGNAILIETSLISNDDFIHILHPVPTPWGDVTPDPALTCPNYAGPILKAKRVSIYILYAHLNEVPVFTNGEEVRCGEAIGEIGMSGNALNPHVHIEARLGPKDAVFDSMAHYDSSSSLEEMGSYCQWRVSGIFQHFDPMLLLKGLPATP